MNNSTHINYGDLASCPHAVSIFFTTVMAIISIAAFFGNILVIAAVYKTSSLKTSTNYYYVNMAVSDFLVSLTTCPLYLTRTTMTNTGESLLQGALGTFSCKVGAYFRIVSHIVSILNLVLIAVDRFIAIAFPLKATFITRKVRAVLLLATWLIPMAYCFPIFYNARLGQETRCRAVWNGLANMAFAVSAIVIYNFVPLVAITAIYSRIMQVLRTRTRPDYAAKGTNLQRKRTEQNQNVMKIFKCIVATYFICLFPFGVYHMLENTITIADKCRVIEGFCDYIFPFFSTAINPIIYFHVVPIFAVLLKSCVPIYTVNVVHVVMPQITKKMFPYRN